MGKKAEKTAKSTQTAPLTRELAIQCNALPDTVERTGNTLAEQYYDRLAEKTLEPKPKKGEHDEDTSQLLQSAQKELDCLHRTARLLFQSYQSASELEDELRVRIQDVRASRKRKWYVSKAPANAGIDLAEKRLNHFAQGLSIYKLLLIFMVGSFAGLVVEMLWCFARYGIVESRRGLVYGPFSPLYGTGAVLLTLFLYRFRNRGRLWSFLGGFLVGSALEYACSWGMETLMGTRSWDYSQMPMNLNGRICFTYSVFWGLLGIVWIKNLYPRMVRLILKIPNQIGKAVTWALTAFMIFDILVSCAAMGRWSMRVRGVPPENAFWQLVDNRFPDERMERIYANMEFLSAPEA